MSYLSPQPSQFVALDRGQCILARCPLPAARCPLPAGSWQLAACRLPLAAAAAAARATHAVMLYAEASNPRASSAGVRFTAASSTICCLNATV